MYSFSNCILLHGNTFEVTYLYLIWRRYCDQFFSEDFWLEAGNELCVYEIREYFRDWISQVLIIASLNDCLLLK